MTIDHDLHTHTVLSACSHDPAATPANMIEAAADAGLATVGFSNHMWDSQIPGASPWYAPQSFEHISQIRQEMPADTNGVRVLVGCETENCGDGRVGISRAVADALDYVLIPFSHFHMKGFVEPPGIENPEQVGDLMVRRCSEVLELGLATGLAHPFLPCGHRDSTDEILATISDDAFAACFRQAARCEVSIEITTGFFPSLTDGELPGCHDIGFLRMLSIAKEAGCWFHFASDTHSLAGVGVVTRLAGHVKDLGIREDDILPLARRA